MSVSKSKSQSDYMPAVNIDGIMNVVSLDAHHSRWWWAMFVLALALSALVGMFSCVQVSLDYFKESTATKIEVKQVESMQFPRVTICPLTPDLMDGLSLWPYLNRKFPDEDERTKKDLVGFILAGSGFVGLDSVVRAENVTDTITLNDLYLTLRGNMTVQQYYKLFMDAFGFSCANIATCNLGGEDPKKGCCSLFEVLDTIEYGRCLTLKPTHQQMPDYLGKLIVYLYDLNSFLGLTQSQDMVAFTHQYADVRPSPRFYLRSSYHNKFRIKAQKIILIENCGPNAFGMSNCRVDRSLGAQLRTRFNCTLPYWPVPYEEYEVCEPGLIFDRYEEVITSITTAESHHQNSACATPCERWNFEAAFESQFVAEGFLGGWLPQRLDILYSDLQYEELREESMISLFGYISQIGGQLGLFLGCSIISFCQIGLAGCLCCKRQSSETIRKRSQRKITQQVGPGGREANRESLSTMEIEISVTPAPPSDNLYEL